MLPSLSASILSAALASTTPLPDGYFNKNDTGFSLHKSTPTLVNNLETNVQNILYNPKSHSFPHPSQKKNESIENHISPILFSDLEKNIGDLGLSPLREKLSGSFHGSEQELSSLVNITLLESTHELSTTLQKNKGFFQISKKHWEELVNIANDSNKDGRERLIALIRLISIVNFFTLLVWVYSLTIRNTYQGKKTPSLLFGGFTITNGLGAVGLFLAGTPLEGSGYAIATVAAAITFTLLRKNEKKDGLSQKHTSHGIQTELKKANEKIQELTRQITSQEFRVTDNTGNTVNIPYEYLGKHTSFSVYDTAGRPIFISPGLLEKLEYTMQEIWAYYDEHGEVTTLFYKELDQQEQVRSCIESLRYNSEGYEEIFYPISKSGIQLALKFTTKPHPFSSEKNPISLRFAEDITGEHLAKKSRGIDILTGESNRFGFQEHFHKLAHCIENRKLDKKSFPKETVLAFGDVDSFKRVNDTYGHQNADIILKELSLNFRSHFRPDDCIARLGGDEFGIICAGASKEDIAHKLSGVRNEFSSTVFEIKNGKLAGKIVYTNQREALLIADKNNETVKTTETDARHCFIGGISFSMGLIGEEIPGTEDKEEIESLCSKMEEQAELTQKYIKHLECLRPNDSPKNAIAYSVFSENGELLKITILHKNGKEIIIEGGEELKDAENKINDEISSMQSR